MKSIAPQTIGFTASTRTLDFSPIPNFNVNKLLAVINTTKSQIIYGIGQPQYSYTSLIGNTLMTLTYDTTTMSNSDVLSVMYDYIGLNTVANSQSFTLASNSAPLPSLNVNSSGVTSIWRADNYPYVALDPTSLFFDNFEILDTTNNWILSGSTLPSVSTGILNLNAGTTASTSSYMRSKPLFGLSSTVFLRAGTLVQLETGAVTGNKRWWGLGIPASSPTVSLPLNNGVVFETLDTTGELVGVVYSNGVRTTQVLLTRPTDGSLHRYAIFYRSSRAYFEIDSVTVGSISFPNPAVSNLPLTIGSVNGGSTLGVTAVLNSTLLSLGDTGRNNFKISDATYPWQQLKIDPSGALDVNLKPSTNTIGAVTITSLSGGSATINDSGALIISNTQDKFRDGFFTYDTTSNWKTIQTGTGMAITTAGALNGARYLNISTGVATNQETIIQSIKTFKSPYKIAFGISISQRIVNQEFFVEMVSVDSNGNVETDSTFASTNLNNALNAISLKFDNTTPANAQYITRGFGISELNSGAVSFGGTTVATGGSPNFIPATYFELNPDTEMVVFNAYSIDSLNAPTGFFKRTQNLPDPTKNYVIRIRVRNLGSAPASTTDFRLHFVRMVDSTRITVDMARHMGRTTDVASSIPMTLTTALPAGANSIGNLNTVTTLTNLSNLNGGQTAHSSPATGAPIRVGGRVLPITPDLTLVAGDASDLGITTAQQALIKQFSSSDLDYNFNGVITNSTTANIFKNTAGASLRNYITCLVLSSDALSGSTQLVIKDGAISTTSVTANVFTSGTHDYKIGDNVIFSNVASYSGILAGTMYYVLTVPSTTTYTLSTTPNGTTLVVTGTGTATSNRILFNTKIQTSGILNPINIQFPTPLRGTPNTTLDIQTVTASGAGSVYYNIQGYVGF